MTNIEKIESARRLAPSYFNLLDDGAPFKCSECGDYSRRGMVSAFTPDGKQATFHYDCLDDEWVKNATCMGAI